MYVVDVYHLAYSGHRLPYSLRSKLLSDSNGFMKRVINPRLPRISPQLRVNVVFFIQKSSASEKFESRDRQNQAKIY